MEIKDIISSGILELYAAGLTSQQESAEVAQWLVQYPEVAQELADISAGVEAYAQANAIAPAPGVKDKIFAQINDASKAKVIAIDAAGKNFIGQPGVPAFWRTLAAASVILLVGSIAFNMSTYNKYKQAGDELVAARQSLDTLSEKSRLMEADMNVVQNKYSVPVALKGLEAAPNAAAKIFWMENTGEVFIDPTNLPETPAGKQYQLWGFVDGKPVDGGMIITSKTGNKYHIQKMKSFGKVEAFAISLEPEKGNPTPQGPIFVMGKM